MAAPSSSTSTAALTNGAVQPLDPRPDLRVVGRTDKPPAWKGEVKQAGAVLQAPQPVNDYSPHGTAAGPVTGFNVAGGASRSLTYEQAQAMLTAYGVTWQRLEAGPEPGEWKFNCSVPNRQNPSIRRFYESRAGDPLAAVRAVVEQIEKERK